MFPFPIHIVRLLLHCGQALSARRGRASDNKPIAQKHIGEFPAPGSQKTESAGLRKGVATVCSRVGVFQRDNMENPCVSFDTVYGFQECNIEDAANLVEGDLGKRCIFL